MLLLYFLYIVIHFLAFNIMKKALSNFTVYAMVGAAVFMVWWIITSRERFGVPEFLDRTNQDRTAASWHSSYAQTTNNMKAPDRHSAPQGEATGLRVGLYEAHSSQLR